jgi:hypothetical protein
MGYWIPHTRAKIRDRWAYCRKCIVDRLQRRECREMFGIVKGAVTSRLKLKDARVKVKLKSRGRYCTLRSDQAFSANPQLRIGWLGRTLYLDPNTQNMRLFIEATSSVVSGLSFLKIIKYRSIGVPGTWIADRRYVMALNFML